MAESPSSNLSNQKPSGPIVGIDLGTTHSLVAYVRNGEPEILSSREGKRLIPSVVSFEEKGGAPIIGYQAKQKKLREPRNTVFSVKRLLGRGFEDVEADAEKLPYELERGEGIVKVRVGGRSYTAVEISALILKELKLAAEQALGTQVSQAVITVPAYFNDSQRQATRAAGRLAGLDVLRIVNEPTAAALAYGWDRKKEGIIAVYDLGGGTFDISILKLQNGIFEVLATHGNTALGGDDLDRAIMQYVADELKSKWGINPFESPEMTAELIEKSELAKIALSEREQSGIELNLPGRGCFSWVITRADFEKWATPILEKTIGPCEQALKDAGITREQLSDVVMVGGPTRLQIVQDVARKIFNRVPNTSMHPDEVVASGAAIQADILAGNNRDFLLLDVVPLSLGLETYGGLMSPLIPRNTRIPTTAKETFTTFVDNQTGVDIHVLQGEREKVADNRSLARFKLKGIKPMPAGLPRVEVTFLIDADGILQVAAKDLMSGNEQVVEVRPSYGLTEQEIEKMLSSSQAHAEEDVKYRALIEARNKAEPVLRSTEKNLAKAFELLSKEEAGEIARQAEELKQAIQGSDVQKISDAQLRLERVTTQLADLLVKEAIIQASKKSK